MTVVNKLQTEEEAKTTARLNAFKKRNQVLKVYVDRETDTAQDKKYDMNFVSYLQDYKKMEENDQGLLELQNFLNNQEKIQEKEYSGVLSNLQEYISVIKKRQTDNDQFIYHLTQLLMKDDVKNNYQHIEEQLQTQIHQVQSLTAKKIVNLLKHKNERKKQQLFMQERRKQDKTFTDIQSSYIDLSRK